MDTYITTNTSAEVINISSNLTSQNDDINLTSNAINAGQNSKNDVNIIASNITTSNNINVDINGAELNIKSADNTLTTTNDYKSYTPNYGEVAAQQAIVNGITGFVGGFLGAGLNSIAIASTKIGTAALGMFQWGQKIANNFSQFSQFLATADFTLDIALSEIPFLGLTDGLYLFPVAMGTKIILTESFAIANEEIAAEFNHGKYNAEYPVSETNKSNSTTENIGTVNSNLNGNLVLK